VLGGFVQSSLGEILDLKVYNLRDMMHIFKNAEAHAMAEGFGTMAIANAFQGETKCIFLVR
jgi:hypothetical protein